MVAVNAPVTANRGGVSTFSQTWLNTVKSMFGTGVLALPFAAKEAG
jgi:amino acid permease